jgi:hypothetical protein
MFKCVHRAYVVSIATLCANLAAGDVVNNLQDQAYPNVGPEVKIESNFNTPTSHLVHKQAYVTMVTTSKYVIGAEVRFIWRKEIGLNATYFTIGGRCLQNVSVRSTQLDNFLL